MQYSTIFTDEGTKVGGEVGEGGKDDGWRKGGGWKEGEGESGKGRDLDFYHGSILVLRQRLPSLTSSQSSSPCSFSVSRPRTISPTPSEEVT